MNDSAICRAAAAVVISGSVLAAGCGGAGVPAQAVRPKDQSAAAALGEKATAECHDVSGKPGEPLIVDWTQDQRGNLEAAMKEGVAVVTYDCKSIRVLPECHLEGSYGFMGLTRREQVVQLKDADEMSANLPLSGLKISAEMQRGSTLDVAMVTVGKRRTSWDAPTRKDLKGTCDGASHFVRSAMVGAFATDMGSEGKVRAAAELFVASAKGASSSSKSMKNKEGDVSDCQKASPDDDKAPPQCGAPIRLLLVPLPPASATQAAAPAEPPKEPVAEPKIAVTEEGSSCPAGLVWTGGKCARANAATPHQCKASDLTDCQAQCDKGHTGSCGTAGVLLASRKDFAKALPLTQKGCDGDHAAACGAFGTIQLEGLAGKADATVAIPALKKGCDGGDPGACRVLGRATLEGTAPAAKDEARAAALFQKACEGGDGTGCNAAGDAYLAGRGVNKDPVRALGFKRRACDGGNAAACVDAAGAMETGSYAGTRLGKNDMLAGIYFQRACYRGEMRGCTGVGRMSVAGGKSDPAAKMNLSMSCSRGDAEACALLNVGFGEHRPVMAAKAISENQSGCSRGDAHACATLGLLRSTQSKDMGRADLQRACSMGDTLGCALQKKLQ